MTPATIVLPVTLASRASHHNRRAEEEAARTGRPAGRQSVGARAVAGVLGGAAIDSLLVVAAFVVVYTTTSTH